MRKFYNLGPRPDVTESGVCSGSTLFANTYSSFYKNDQNNTKKPKIKNWLIRLVRIEGSALRL